MPSPKKKVWVQNFISSLQDRGSSKERFFLGICPKPVEIFYFKKMCLWQTHIVALPVKFDKVFIKQRRNIGKRTFQGYPDETTHWLIEMSTLSQQWAVGAQPHNFPLLSF